MRLTVQLDNFNFNQNVQANLERLLILLQTQNSADRVLGELPLILECLTELRRLHVEAGFA